MVRISPNLEKLAENILKILWSLAFGQLTLASGEIMLF
jgi:hypothetical protein